MDLEMLSILGDPYHMAAAELAGAPLVVVFFPSEAISCEEAVDAAVLNFTDGAIMSCKGPCVAKL